MGHGLAMTVSDLAREAAKQYCDAVPMVEWVEAALDRVAAPPNARGPEQVAALARRWRRVLEEQIVEYFTIPELRALARFYVTPEGAAVMRKLPAWSAAVTPMLEAETVAWARGVCPSTSAGGAAAGDPAQHRSP